MHYLNIKKNPYSKHSKIIKSNSSRSPTNNDLSSDAEDNRIEQLLSLANEATLNEDRVLAESYYQHAEYYLRQSEG